MAGHVKDVTPNHDTDVNTLFEKYTVEEIRDIEKKLRQSIEKKKEDLRQMVGERYRDLIEAADTIKDMKKSADNVTHSIARIQDLCNNLKQSHAPKLEGYSAPKDAARKSQQRLIFTSAVNLKLIMDMPERIWSALDMKQYLLATRLYLLAKHIYNSIQLDPNSAAVVGHFPLLARQWASICHFKAAILQYCRICMRDSTASDQVVSDCLGSIFLLEDLSMEQVFNEFLSARADAVHQLFSADSSDMSVKSLVCDVICLIVNTVYQIYTIFFPDEKKSSSEDASNQVACNMLVTLLKTATSKSESGAIVIKEAVSPSSQQYLSQAVNDFRPSSRHPLVPVSLQVLTSSSRQFLDSCVANVQEGLAKVLSYITTVKGLATIRDELWNLLKNDERLPMWEMICSQLFGRQVVIWSEFAANVFILRIEELLRSQFDAAASAGKTQMSKMLLDFNNSDDRSMQWERDLSSYVWTDSIYDMPNSVSSSSGIVQNDGGGALLMKARGYTPAVQSLCRGLDHRLKAMLDDVVCYLQCTGNQNSVDIGPFNRFEDRDRIQKFVQTACEDSISKQLDYVHEQLDSSKQQLVQCNDNAGCQVTIYRILLMARYTSALCELSPHLHLCMSCQIGDEAALPVISRLASKKTYSSRALPKSVENPCWSSLRDKLVSFSNNAFSVWVGYTCGVSIDKFKSTLCDESSQTILKYGTQWDCIEIEEETEDDKKIKSTIRVPVQASWYVQAMLYDLCETINQLGGQAVPSSSLSSLVRQLIDGILDAYEQLLKSGSKTSLSQTRSLQLLFDLKFFMNILGNKEDSEASGTSFKRFQNVCNTLESFIDPFDMDVFTPYIQNHLSRHTQRSSMLYGLLVSAERRLVGGSAYSSLPTSGTQDQHNILPIASCQNRFSLLPLSVQSSNIQPIIQPPKSKIALPPSMSLLNTSNLPQPARNSSSSFLEQMSNMWFSGNK